MSGSRSSSSPTWPNIRSLQTNGEWIYASARIQSWCRPDEGAPISGGRTRSLQTLLRTASTMLYQKRDLIEWLRTWKLSELHRPRARYVTTLADSRHPTESKKGQSSADAALTITTRTFHTSTSATCSSTRSWTGTTANTHRRFGRTSSEGRPSSHHHLRALLWLSYIRAARSSASSHPLHSFLKDTCHFVEITQCRGSVCHVTVQSFRKVAPGRKVSIASPSSSENTGGRCS